MSMKNTLIASAVASLFMSGAAVAKGKANKKAAEVTKCAGINECKGHGACSGADNSCKSKNECKGKGWTETASAKDCEAKGGKVVTAQKM